MNEDVLITCNGCVGISWRNENNEWLSGDYAFSDNELDRNSPTAWMPLPEPYIADSEE